MPAEKAETVQSSPGQLTPTPSPLQEIPKAEVEAPTGISVNSNAGPRTGWPIQEGIVANNARVAHSKLWTCCRGRTNSLSRNSAWTDSRRPSAFVTPRVVESTVVRGEFAPKNANFVGSITFREPRRTTAGRAATTHPNGRFQERGCRRNSWRGLEPEAAARRPHPRKCTEMRLRDVTQSWSFDAAGNFTLIRGNVAAELMLWSRPCTGGAIHDAMDAAPRRHRKARSTPGRDRLLSPSYELHDPRRPR